MNDFTSQLAATRANLERLEALAAIAPDLLEHGHLISISPDATVIYVHAQSHQDVDWPAMAQKYQKAQWHRDDSAASRNHYDWKGFIDGVEINILGAEARPKPQPLFAEEILA